MSSLEIKNWTVTKLVENDVPDGAQNFRYLTNLARSRSIITWRITHTITYTFNKARTGPRSAARFKLEVHPRSKLTKCPEQEQKLKK